MKRFPSQRSRLGTPEFSPWELYSDAVLATERQFALKADLVGCHGPNPLSPREPARFFGRKIAATWQTGEAAIIAPESPRLWFQISAPQTWRPAARARPWSVSRLHCFFRDSHVGRIVQNIAASQISPQSPRARLRANW